MIHILMSRGILGHKEIVPIVTPYIKKKHRVVVVLLSFFEYQVQNESDYQKLYEMGSEYYQKIINSFAPYGILEHQIEWINYYQDSKAKAIEKIKNADIIYFPGGAPDLMMMRIIKLGIKEAIEAHQGIFIGSSAGTMIQFKNYYISKDYDYSSFSYQHGLNLLSGFFVEVHYRRKRKQKAAMRKVFRAYKEDIYTLPDDGLIIVDQYQIKTYLSSQLMYHKKGVVK